MSYIKKLLAANIATLAIMLFPSACLTVLADDTTQPTLNAAVSSGVLNINAYDTESEIVAIYVNDYEYTDLTEGTLSIQLQLFDASYQYFSIYAVDAAGNVSSTYRVTNPYYGLEDDELGDLVEDATATEATEATGVVTSHTVIETDGETSKEFYSIETSSGKTFYLIIDSEGDDEIVYFLTSVSENDLLNTLESTSATLPQNSAAIDNGIDDETVSLSTTDGADIIVEENASESILSGSEDSSYSTYVIYGVCGVIFAVAIYFLRFRKKTEYLDDEDDYEAEFILPEQMDEDEDIESIDDEVEEGIA